MNYIIDVDSIERDFSLYPDSNDFVIPLNRPLYNISDFTLVSANIPLTQTLINDGNNKLVIDGVTYTLNNKFYSTGSDLAYDLEQQVAGSNITSVTYDSNVMALTFSNVGTSNNFTFEFDNESPFNILGFDMNNVTSSGGSLTGGVVNLHGPTTILIRVTNGLDDMKKKVYKEDGQFLYTARILTSVSTGNMLYYKGPDDPVEYYFHEGKFKNIDQLRFRFYYINGSRLVPYDFGNRNLFMKFKIKCSLDKLEPLSEQVTALVEEKEEDIKKPEFPKVYIMISVFLFVGLVFMLTFKRQPRTPVAPGA
jgi:hypothetical protein